MDPVVTPLTKEPEKWLLTASGKVKVDHAGVLFARIVRPGENSVIIRARALLVTDLTSEHLIPVSAMAGCKGCSVSFWEDTAEISLRDLDDNNVTIRTANAGNLYPMQLEPLTTTEMNDWRGHFDLIPGPIPQVQVESSTVIKQAESAPRALSADAIDINASSGTVPETVSGTVPGTVFGTVSEPLSDKENNVELSQTSPQSPTEDPTTTVELQVFTQDVLNELTELHHKLGHAPVDRIIEAINLGALTTKIDAKILRAAAKTIVIDCPSCQQANKNALPRMKFKTAPDLKPFNSMHFDLIPLPQVKDPPKRPLDDFIPPQRNRYILLGIDEQTRYAVGHAIPTKKEEDIATAFYNCEATVRAIMTKALNADSKSAALLGYTWDAVRDRGKCVFRHFHGDGGNEFVANTLTYQINMPKNSALGDFRQPYIVRKGPFREGGAPVNTTSSPDRKYENGLVERHHQTLERKAHAALLQAGIGIKGYEHAYLNAIEAENVLPTAIPVAGSHERSRGVPFKEALGFPYRETARPLHAIGALAYPVIKLKEKHNFPRSVGVFLGMRPYPSRDMKVTCLHQDVVTYRITGPETKVGDRHFTTTSATDRVKILKDQGMDGQTDNIIFTDDDAETGDNIARDGANHDDTQENALTHYQDTEGASAQDSNAEAADSRPTQDSNAEATDAHPNSNPKMTSDDPDINNIDDADIDNDSPPPNSNQYSSSDTDTDTDSDPDDDSPTAAAAIVTAAMITRKVINGTPDFTFPMFHQSHRLQPTRRPKGHHQVSTAHAIRPGTLGQMRKEQDEFTEAEWDEARKKEYGGMLKHRVWEPSILPAGKRKISTKEVLKVRNDNSLKVRVTARGFQQRQNVDYFETYSAVASPASIRTVVTIGASFGLPLQTADAEQAYLQADLKEEIYLDIPPVLFDAPEYKDSLKNANCLRLLKGLYGTKQAGRGWYEKLKKAIISAGLKEAPEDPCLYYRQDDNESIDLVVCTVVDDFLGAADDTTWADFITTLERNGIQLDRASVGNAKEFNGMRITRPGKHHYELDQRPYLAELEKSYGQKYSWRAKANIDTPLGPTLDKGLTSHTQTIQEQLELSSDITNTLSKSEKIDLEMAADDDKRKAFTHRYLSLLGSLIWPAHMTRPDLAFAVSAAGEHSQMPMTRHLAALERTLSYALNTKQKCLVFNCTDTVKQMNLAAFSDSDFASDEDTRKSRSGIWLSINECPIYWTSKRQTVIADSTTAAETIAAHATLRQLRCISGNLRTMKFDVDYAPQFCDNAATLKRITNDRASDGFGAKHLSINTKMLQEAASEEHKDMWPFHVDTTENVPDIFTKGHLSGADSDARWSILEQRSRGDPPSRGWITERIMATRPKLDHKGKSVLSMELAQPMINLEEFFTRSSWGRVYENHFTSHIGFTKVGLTRALTSAAEMTVKFEARAMVAEAGLPSGDDGLLLLPREFTILEVFCGENKSASRGIRRLCSNPGMLRIITVDVKHECDPTIIVDVRKWNPSSAIGGKVDFAWLSPPCPEYSKAKTTGTRDLITADEIAKAALRIITQVRPTAWALENPTGLLRHRPFMRELAHLLRPTTYCMFNDGSTDNFEYRKETDIYTNIPCPLPHCRLTPCHHKQKYGNHSATAQRGHSKNGTPGNKVELLHRVPHGLVQMLFLFAFRNEDSKPSTFLPSSQLKSVEQRV